MNENSIAQNMRKVQSQQFLRVLEKALLWCDFAQIVLQHFDSHCIKILLKIAQKFAVSVIHQKWTTNVLH